MNEYYSSMDREISTSEEMKEIDKAASVGVDEFGASTNPFEHQTDALKARIFHGANSVEFSFFGAGKGRKEQPTPESFGRRERRDMRELAEINEVNTSVHATVGIQGLSGLNMQQQTFSDDQRKQAIDEIKRAIHFAADATTGGAVVFHTGEAPRSMVSRFRDKDDKAMFEMYPEEAEREMHFLADPVTKRLIGPIRENDRVAVPVYDLDENGEKKYLLDENGKKVQDELLKDYDEINKGQIPLYKYDEKGNIGTEYITFSEWKKRRIKEYEEVKHRKPNNGELIRDFYQFQTLLQVQYNLYFGKGNEDRYKKGIEQREKVMKALNFYKELKKKVPEEDWWKMKKETGAFSHFVPSETEDPVEYLQKRIWDIDRELSYTRELAVSGRRQATEQLETVKRSKLAHDFAMDETAKSMAELGVYTWQKNEEAKKKQGDSQMKLKDDIYIAPENLFPETYGAHPDELRDIVVKGRKAMANELHKRYGMKEKKAEELAKKHIRATFDIGHANIWRKYFVSKNGESLEDRDKRFNKWLLKKTKALVDDGIVGHIHVNDNFGFNDEHLAAGDGNAPVKDFILQAKEAGLSDFIVESSGLNPMTTLPDTWAHFDSPVYKIHVPGFTTDSWTDPSIPTGWSDVYRKYFGRTEGPRYLVGDTSPSEEFKGAPFYTGVGLE